MTAQPHHAGSNDLWFGLTTTQQTKALQQKVLPCVLTVTRIRGHCLLCYQERNHNLLKAQIPQAKLKTHSFDCILQTVATAFSSKPVPGQHYYIIINLLVFPFKQGGEQIYFFSSFWMMYTPDRVWSIQKYSISNQQSSKYTLKTTFRTINFGVSTCFIALLSLDTLISQTTGWGCSAIAYYVIPFLLWIVVFIIDVVNRCLFTLQVRFFSFDS